MNFPKTILTFCAALASFEMVRIAWADDLQPAARVPIQESRTGTSDGTLASLRSGDYSYGFWLNGWRRTKDVTGPAIFAVETNHYDFSLNPSNLRRAYFAGQTKPVAYLEALHSETNRFQKSANAEFLIELEQNGKTYRAVSCKAGGAGSTKLSAARMWESGRYVQHFDFIGLNLQDSNGNALSCDGTLDLVAWPDSVTFTATLAPVGSAWTDAILRVALKGAEIDCESKRKFEGTWTVGEQKSVTLTAPSRQGVNPNAGVSIQVATSDGQFFPVAFERQKNCFVASVPKLKRLPRSDWQDGTRGYDDFSITIENQGKQDAEVPFLLDMRDPAGITGLCPILCDRSGRPTGIPVQLSKNWHHGAYLMGYSKLPARPGRSEYLLRVAYGFYGTVPAASHAQLSLIGYSRGENGNGRWDQLAIGSWGETFCFDMDMSLTNIAICDVRMLMARKGLQGAKWGWTDAGWGGDWLGMKNAGGEKLSFSNLKTAYISQGPCLTDVRYAGFYGAKHEVSLAAEVQTLRTDDYARTFQKLRYTFNATANANDVWLYKMGGTPSQVTPKIAYGNRDGLIAERPTPPSMKAEEMFLEKTPLTGKGPWWVAFPGTTLMDGRNWGTGYRALIIRSYKATLAGKTVDNPTIAMPVHKANPQGKGVDVNLLLTAPPETAGFQPNDTVEMTVEWITLPRVADDYYGPNEPLRKHLSENPSSWQTTFREAVGNDLKVTTQNSKVLQRYPIVIQTERFPVTVDIEGGVGFVPIRFEGLKAKNVALYEVVEGKEVKLNQSVKGNDYWQTGCDDAGRGFSVVYNLPLDKRPKSKWVLKSESEVNN